ncbi:MAG TPA: PLP-dependent aminotransferase family protein, partial [Nitrospirota bacterium]
MNTPIPWCFLPDREEPLVPQIKSHVIAMVYAGYLWPGQKMLSIAGFAKILGVNKKTIEATYKALAAQKVLEIRRPLGYFVSRHSIRSGAGNGSPLAAFSFNAPQAVYDPKALAVSYLALGSDSPDLMPAVLDKHLREYRKAHRAFHHLADCKSKLVINYAISQLLSYRAMHADENQFHIIHGAGRNLSAVALTLLEQGSAVAMESMDDVPAIASFQLVKAKLFFTGSDKEGMLIDELEKIADRQPLKAVFVRPAASYPQSLPLSAGRRAQLMTLADRHQFVIIEMYKEHEFWAGPEPLTFWESYKKDRVIYLSPVSRMTYQLSAMGLVVGPRDFIKAVCRIGKQYTVIDRITELLLANMVQEGTFSILLDEMQKHYRKLCTAIPFILDNYLPGIATYTMPAAGCTVWVELSEEFDPAPVLKELEELGFYRAGSIADGYTGQPVNALMIGYGTPTLDKIESGIKLIA